MRVGKPVKGGPKSVPNTAVTYPEPYMGTRANRLGRITSEPADLTVLVMQDSASVGDWNTNKFTKWYEKRTGVRVHWKVISSVDSMTKINAMIAAGDVPDVLMPNPGLTPSQVMYYGKQGLFIKLNKLIDEYGAQTRHAFSDYPEFASALKSPDGSYYSLPYINDCFHCHTMPARTWIYTPWLDKLGLSMPTTTQEFEEALYAFKTGDPNGDGKKDIVPFAVATDPVNGNSMDMLFMNAFLYNPGGGPASGQPWMRLEDGKVDFAANRPEWREGLKYVRRLVKRGLIDSKSFTQTGDQLLLVGNSKKPVLGCSMGNIWASFLTMDMVDSKARWRDYHAMPSLQGPKGVRFNPWDYYNPLAYGRFMITKYCKNPEIALMWGDGLMEMEATSASYNGILGTNWDWGKPGEKGIDGRQGIWKPNFAKPVQPGDSWGQMGMQYRTNDYRLSEVIDPKAPVFEKQLYEETRASLYPYRVPQERVLPPVFLSANQVGESAEVVNLLKNYVRQSFAKFALGQLDPASDSDWKSYTDSIDSMGLKRYMKIQQAAYDAKYARG